MNYVLGFLATIAVIGYVFVYLPLNGIHWDAGHGQHTGYVTALETNGVLIHTNRAYVKTDTQSSQEDQYCVLDPDVMTELQKAVDTKEHVTITYFSWLVPGHFYCNGEDAIISKVDTVNN